MSRFYLVHVALRGNFEDIRSGERYSPRTAHLLHCSDLPGLKIADDCKLLLIKVDRAYMGAVFENLTGSPAGSALQVTTAIDLDSAPGRRFDRALTFTLAELDRASEDGDDVTLPRWTEEFLVSALVESAIRTAEPPSTATALEPRPYYVKRAETFIEAHPGDDFTVGDVAQHAGVSVRTLQGAFRSRRTTLLGFRDAIRLDRIFDELQRAEPRSTTVGAVAS